MAGRITFEAVDTTMDSASDLEPGEVFLIYRGEDYIGNIRFPGGYVTYDNISSWSISRAARREFGPDVPLHFSDYKRGIEKRGHREYNY